MLYTELEDIIYSWISENIELDIIWKNQNGMRPNPPYITLNILSYTKLGEKNTLSVDDDGNREVKYDEDISLEIESFGMDSQNELQKIKDSIQNESILSSLADQGIVIRNDFAIKDVSSLLDETIEKRYIYELTLGFVHSIIENVGIIETINFSEEVQ